MSYWNSSYSIFPPLHFSCSWAFLIYTCFWFVWLMFSNSNIERQTNCCFLWVFKRCFQFTTTILDILSVRHAVLLILWKCFSAVVFKQELSIAWGLFKQIKNGFQQSLSRSSFWDHQWSAFTCHQDNEIFRTKFELVLTKHSLRFHRSSSFLFGHVRL